MHSRWFNWRTIAGQVFFARADNKTNNTKYIVGEQHYVNGKLANPYAESTKELDDLRVQLAHIAQERPNPVETILKSYEPYKCCVARVEFDDFIKYIESLDTSDDGSNPPLKMIRPLRFRWIAQGSSPTNTNICSLWSGKGMPSPRGSPTPLSKTQASLNCLRALTQR